MIPYTRHDITPEDEAAVLRVLRSGYLTQGPEVEAFEAELAALTGARYAVAVNSGTAALHLAYLASLKNLPWHVPAISFVATANALLHAGQAIHWCDTDPETGQALGFKNVGVTLGGNMDEAMIVDACHGPLQHLGILATCFSFHPAKHVAAGEGGAIVTNDKYFAARCYSLRSHGRRGGTEMHDLGYNYRMPELSAALARSQLTRYHAGVEARRQRAARYDAAFADHPAIQPVPHGPESARHLYQILLTDDSPPVGSYFDGLWSCVEYRDYVQHQLTECGISTAIHYPVIPLQPYYRERYGYKPGDFPGAEAYAARTLSIPLFPSMTDAEQEHVITSLLEVCG